MDSAAGELHRLSQVLCATHLQQVVAETQQALQQLASVHTVAEHAEDIYRCASEGFARLELFLVSLERRCLGAFLLLVPHSTLRPRHHTRPGGGATQLH